MEKDFIKGKIEIKEFDNGGKIIKVAIPFTELVRIKSDKDWVNFDIKTSQTKGTLYMENNKYVPKDQTAPQNTSQTPNIANNEPQMGEPEEIQVENIPF